MTERPISFVKPMIRALLREIKQPGSSKTQTRRVLKPRPPSTHSLVGIYGPGLTAVFGIADASHDVAVQLRFLPGDRLYVREHWRVSRKWDETKPRDLPARTMTVMFDAGGSIANQPGRGDADPWHPSDWPRTFERPDWAGRFRHGMHMPKWASRITLVVTDVRVQRLQDISETDAIAEGIDGSTVDGWRCYMQEPKAQDAWVYPRESYRTLWNSINGADAWNSNPWVAAYTFRPILGNIDVIRERADA